MSELAMMMVRTIFLYLLILIIFRLMGKREIGELSVFDFVVNIMIAEMAVMAIEDSLTVMLHSIASIILLMIIQITIARLSLKSKNFRDLVDGSPTIIISQGKIDEKAMRRQRYNFDDLLQQLREKDIRNIADVEFAILEPSGKLSVFEKNKMEDEITLPLIIDGIIQKDHLKQLKQTELWVKQQLKKRGYPDINKVSFCSIQNGQFYIDLIDE
jgi:uncharacterized membrane protein YcaP (DUF421 family)